MKIRKNDRERSIWAVGSLAEKVFRPLRGSVKGVAFENHHLLEKVDENFIVWVQAQPKMGSCGLLKRERPEDSRPAREREAASLLLTDNANCLQAQLALTENVMGICIN